MRLLTWNINGIRANKIPLPELFNSLESDIICLQETKVTRDMLDEMTADVEGYNAYFSFSRKKSGYSGVATYCRNSCTPVKAEEGLTEIYSKKDAKDLVGCYGNLSDFSSDELVSLDCEGRAVITQHEIRLKDSTCCHVAIINVYCPRYDAENEDRHQYKLRFFALLQVRAETLKKEGSHVIILGDINTTHRCLDHCEPESQGGSNSLPSRLWLNQMMRPQQRDPDLDKKQAKLTELSVLPSHVTGGMFVDTFRHLNPNQAEAYTNWCLLTGARQTNFGRRLDYILCDSDLALTTLTDCTVMSMVQGSDHCPVRATFDFSVVTAIRRPSHCAKLMPEFAGQQQKLSMFFTKSAGLSERRFEKKTPVCKDFSDKLLSDSVDDDNDSKSKKNASPISKPPKSLVLPMSSLKRQSISEYENQFKKKSQKLSSGNKSEKQTSLMGFFNKNNSMTTTTKSPFSKTSSESSPSLPVAISPDFQFDSSIKKKASEQFNMSSNGDISLERSQSDNIGLSECSQPESQNSQKSNDSQVSAWKLLMKGPPPAPLCSQHKELCVLRTVKKAGVNRGKQFYTCARSEGAPGNPEARCNYFVWVKDMKK